MLCSCYKQSFLSANSSLLCPQLLTSPGFPLEPQKLTAPQTYSVLEPCNHQLHRWAGLCE